MLTTTEKHEVAQAEQIERLEQTMLEMPQAECPVVHHFGPGTYIRQVTLPAGALALGHAQRFEQLNIMVTGKVVMFDVDGSRKVLEAPLTFVGPPGRKAGFVLEETIWLNVYATDERDIDKLEAHFLDKSKVWQAHDEVNHRILIGERSKDREDFCVLIDQAGFTPEDVRSQSENEEDQMPMPDGEGVNVTIRESPIEGRGVFLSAPAERGDVIAPARLSGKRTPVGRYTNHSMSPNAEFVKSRNGDIYLVATRRITGCAGGSAGEEVTVNYRQALSLSGLNLIDEGE